MEFFSAFSFYKSAYLNAARQRLKCCYLIYYYASHIGQICHFYRFAEELDYLFLLIKVIINIISSIIFAATLLKEFDEFTKLSAMTSCWVRHADDGLVIITFLAHNILAYHGRRWWLWFLYASLVAVISSAIISR